MSTLAAPLPHAPGRLGVRVFSLSLGVLFLAGIVLFVLARTGAGGHVVRDALHGQRLALPVWLWVSTFFLFASSVALHRTHVAGRGLALAAALGWTFLVFQVPGLLRLVDSARPAPGARANVYVLVLLLTALHALHAAGGVTIMTALARRAHVDRAHVAEMATYWHVVGAAWLAMFTAFALVR